MELKAPLHGRVRNTECKGLVINYGEGGGGGGGLQNEKITGPKLFAPPLLKSGNFLQPLLPAKTSSYHVKTNPTHFVPPL